MRCGDAIHHGSSLASPGRAPATASNHHCKSRTVPLQVQNRFRYYDRGPATAPLEEPPSTHHYRTYPKRGTKTLLTRNLHV